MLTLTSDTLITAIFARDSNALGIVSVNGNTISIYPNPLSQNITIDAGIQSKYKVEIFDANGVKVLSETFSGIEKKINVEDFAAGEYIISLMSDGLYRTMRFVKM